MSKISRFHMGMPIICSALAEICVNKEHLLSQSYMTALLEKFGPETVVITILSPILAL